MSRGTLGSGGPSVKQRAIRNARPSIRAENAAGLAAMRTQSLGAAPLHSAAPRHMPCSIRLWFTEESLGHGARPGP